MRGFAETLYDKLDVQLREINAEEHDSLHKVSKCIHVCKKALKELHEYFKLNNFKSESEEIEFFKELKPRFYSRFIYYVRIFNVETNRPVGSDKMQRKYLRKQLHRIQLFFENNLDFYQYYRTGATHFDESYFLRGRHDSHLLPDELALSIDPEFCTAQSYKVSKMLAYDLLRGYLNSSIVALDRSKIEVSSEVSAKAELQWTGSKVNLIELIYALQEAKVFNDAKADIKQITGYFERAFQLKLGNVYNVFQEMRIRKKNRTIFLDLLKDRLVQRMDEADEGY